jgi:hypothetical protein
MSYCLESGPKSVVISGCVSIYLKTKAIFIYAGMSLKTNVVSAVKTRQASPANRAHAPQRQR